MGVKHTYANVLPNWTGGMNLAVEVGAHEGRVFVAVAPADDRTCDLRCVLDIEDALLLIKGLQDALAALTRS